MLNLFVWILAGSLLWSAPAQEPYDLLNHPKVVGTPPHRLRVMPYVSISGAHSKIAELEYHRITNQADWTKLWLRHKGDSGDPRKYNHYYNPLDLPKVNFASCMVVAVFQGTGWNSAGVDAISIEPRDRSLVFQFDDRSFQTTGGGEKVTAFGIFVVIRTPMELILEENVQGLIGKPPKWKERHRFKAMH